MLTHTLGVCVGFVAVILLCSLVVTTLSQVAQSILGLRTKALRAGVDWLLSQTFKVDERGEYTAVAAKVVSKDVTWMEKNELISDLADRGVVIPEGLRPRFDLQFDVMNRYLTDEFTELMQYISFGLACAVAFTFQLNTPDLLKRISNDAAFRARAEATALQAVAGGRSAPPTNSSLEESSERALARFAARHPELRAAIEEVSGRGSSREELRHEMREVLKDRGVGNLEEFVGEYLGIVGAIQGESAKGARAPAPTDALASRDVVVWPHGLGYYKDINNCIGVLVSAIFISLGAPFWFNTLKNLINLRDMLKPRDQDFVRPTVIKQNPQNQTST